MPGWTILTSWGSGVLSCASPTGDVVLPYPETRVTPSQPDSARRQRPPRWLALVTLVALAGSSPLGAQTQQDVDRAKTDRQEAREDATDVASRIDALDDEAGDLAVKLDLLYITINIAESRLEVATAQVSATQADIAAVATRIADLEAVRSDLESIIVESAITQYVGGHQQAQATVFSAEDPMEWSLRQGLYNIVVSRVTTIQDQLRVINAHLTEAQTTALDLGAAAEKDLADLARVRTDTEAARQTQTDVLLQVQERLDRRLSEAEALAAIDVELSAEIRRGEEEIARRLAVAQALTRKRQREKAAAEQRAEDSAEPTGPRGSDMIARPDEIVNVRGINIHQSIAEQLRNLINAAEADGIIIGGSGWRSTEHQIELRIQNCGGSDYLIFDAPAEACSPPTARPATSNHEAGLALDLTADGRAIVDRNSREFQWLVTNGPNYGFYNLWSEPWHWSVDGR